MTRVSTIRVSGWIKEERTGPLIHLLTQMVLTRYVRKLEPRSEFMSGDLELAGKMLILSISSSY
jgi:hypothetical protein